MSVSQTTAIERNIMPQVGARFFRRDDAVMFEFVVDPNNIIGPRSATKADSEKHWGAWTEFTAGEVAPDVVEIVPDAREFEAPAPPITRVEPLKMDGFAAKLEPQPERQKRKYTRREVA